MYVYLKSPLSFDTLAHRLREILNIPERNRGSGQVDQQRYGDNFGGEYWLFEVLGLELILVRNARDVEVVERSEWPYFLIIYAEAEVEMQTVDCLARYLCGVLRRAGLEADVDTPVP